MYDYKRRHIEMKVIKKLIVLKHGNNSLRTNEIFINVNSLQ